eukprot:8853878-Pyramimonas_sp.AAC.1
MGGKGRMSDMARAQLACFSPPRHSSPVSPLPHEQFQLRSIRPGPLLTTELLHAYVALKHISWR